MLYPFIFLLLFFRICVQSKADSVPMLRSAWCICAQILVVLSMRRCISVHRHLCNQHINCPYSNHLFYIYTYYVPFNVLLRSLLSILGYLIIFSISFFICANVLILSSKLTALTSQLVEPPKQIFSLVLFRCKIK